MHMQLSSANNSTEYQIAKLSRLIIIVISLAFVGYKMIVNSQLGAVQLVGYLSSCIQHVLME